MPDSLRPPRQGGSGAPIVAAVDLVRTYRRGGQAIAALRGVSLVVEAGEFVAVKGPSGSGKSTLLHLLGGLDTPDAGRITIAGHRLDAMSDDALTAFRRRRIGVVFQAFNLVPNLTAEENVALPLLLDGVAVAVARTRAADALAGVGMVPRRSHLPDELSGGELQRVAVARALVIDPVLVLADEPTGNLDTRTGGMVLELLHRTASDGGRTIVMVTHDPGAAASAARVVTVVDGCIEADPCDLPSSAAPRMQRAR